MQKKSPVSVGKEIKMCSGGISPLAFFFFNFISRKLEQQCQQSAKNFKVVSRMCFEHNFLRYINDLRNSDSWAIGIYCQF